MSKITVTGQLTLTGGQLTAKETIVPFSANAVNFGGSDVLIRNTQLDGSVDGEKLILSFWFRNQGSDANRTLLGGAFGNIGVTFNSSNFMVIEIRNPWRFTTTTTKFSTTDNPGWNHVIVSCDTNISKFQVRHNDVDIFSEVNSNIGPTTSSSFQFQLASFAYGAVESNVQSVDSDLSEFWFGKDFLDLDVEANRRKFRDADGKPVDLGSDGSTPNGVIPLIYFSGDASALNAGTNAGSGGNFVMTGSVTNVIDGPSS